MYLRRGLFAVAWLVTLPLLGQDRSVDVHSQTTPPGGARFEVVESTITVRDTYRLDRFTGRVWRLVKNKEDDLVWEEMIVRNRPDVNDSAGARFQVFLSGIAAKVSLLIDTKTGKTWQVVSTKIDPGGEDTESNKMTLWDPLAEENPGKK